MLTRGKGTFRKITSSPSFLDSPGLGDNGCKWHTLYFCSDCQLIFYLLSYDPIIPNLCLDLRLGKEKGVKNWIDPGTWLV